MGKELDVDGSTRVVTQKKLWLYESNNSKIAMIPDKDNASDENPSHAHALMLDAVLSVINDNCGSSMAILEFADTGYMFHFP